MSIGKGTKIGKELIGVIDEVEAVRERKKQLAESEKAIFAAAKAKGFDVKTIRAIIKMRAEDQAKRQEAETLLDTYMHAIGMDDEPPLFAAMGAVSFDAAAREQAVEFLKSIVPRSAELILKAAGTPIRIYRDAEGEARAEEWLEEMPPAERERASDFAGVEGTKASGSTSRVKSAADRAEDAAEAKRRATAKVAEPAGS